MTTQYPLGTGAVAAALGVTEPQLQELIRKHRVHPAPLLMSNRRMWFYGNVVQAADVLGILTPSLQERLAEDKAPHANG